MASFFLVFKANNWDNFRSCDCLKEILIRSGFDKPAYLDGINQTEMNALENNINRDRSIF